MSRSGGVLVWTLIAIVLSPFLLAGGVYIYAGVSRSIALGDQLDSARADVAALSGDLDELLAKRADYRTMLADLGEPALARSGVRCVVESVPDVLFGGYQQRCEAKVVDVYPAGMSRSKSVARLREIFGSPVGRDECGLRYKDAGFTVEYIDPTDDECVVDFDETLGTEYKTDLIIGPGWWRLEESGILNPGAAVVVHAGRPGDIVGLGCAPWSVLCSAPVDAPVLPADQVSG